jgi:hypothetical protein
MRRSSLAAAALMLLAACASSVERGDPADTGRGAPPPVQSPCMLSHAVLMLPDADLGMAPGESRVLDPPVTHHGPAGPRPLMDGCAVAWSVEGTGAVIDSAGRLAIAPTARPGDSLHVVARAMGSSARARVLMVVPGPNPLVGRWRQAQTPNCVGHAGPVGELVLRRSGGMLLTVRPFESYTDIAGSYTFDAATALLRLRSNTRAVNDGLFLEARARVEGGVLELQLLPGGDQIGLFAVMPGDEECRALFHRSGDSP